MELNFGERKIKPITALFSFVSNLLGLSKGHSRSIKAKKNIFASFFFKGFSIIIGFLLVPLVLHYLGSEKYGIWLTISSIISWIGFFDIGLGNGLRNKLAEAFAVKDYILAKTYISTTYIIIFLIIAVIYIFFLIVSHFIPWYQVLNTSPILEWELKRVVFIVFTFFSLRFILKLIGIIFIADQQPAYNNSFAPISSFITLALIYIISKTTSSSLIYISFIYSISPVLVLLLVSFYYFNKNYKHIRPSLKYVDFRHFKSLANLGVKFFLLQVTTLIIFSTDNIIITQILGPTEVTPYNIAFQYFSIPVMIFTIILSPFWSAFTDAWVKKEINWIKNVINKLLLFWLVVGGVVFILILVSKEFYFIWVGKEVEIPVVLSALMGLYVIIRTENSIFVNFINGTGKIKLQVYYLIIEMIINIPISVFFARNLEMGSAGVILGTCISLTPSFVLAPLQYLKIINNKATGIWNR